MKYIIGSVLAGIIALGLLIKGSQWIITSGEYVVPVRTEYHGNRHTLYFASQEQQRAYEAQQKKVGDGGLCLVGMALCAVLCVASAQTAITERRLKPFIRLT